MLGPLQPFAIVSVVAAACFVLQRVAVSAQPTAAATSSTSSSMTSLEQLATRAFNAKIADGTWRRLFGATADTRPPQPYCNGVVDNSWPVVPSSAVVPGSDLERAARTGKFRCAFVAPYSLRSSDNTTVLLLETQVLPSDDDDDDSGVAGSSSNRVSGIIHEYWREMTEYIGTVVGSTLELEWKLYATSREVLEAVANGEADAGKVMFCLEGISCNK